MRREATGMPVKYTDGTLAADTTRVRSACASAAAGTRPRPKSLSLLGYLADLAERH